MSSAYSHDEPVGRRTLPHDLPEFVRKSDATFFITICCRPKGLNHLCHLEIAEKIFGAVRSYRDKQRWRVLLVLIMPDHVHMLVRFGPDVSIKNVVRSWKRFTGRHAGVAWQRDFFDHRLRDDEAFYDKAAYILQNPVRARLVTRRENWPYQLELS